MFWKSTAICECSPEQIASSGTTTDDGIEYCRYCRARIEEASTQADSDRQLPNPDEPGWYPVSATNTSELHYWDGQRWTGDQATAEVPKPPLGFEVRPRTSTSEDTVASEQGKKSVSGVFAWCLALAPLIGLVVAVVLAATGALSGSTIWVAFIAVLLLSSSLFDYLDKGVLRAAGYKPYLGQTLYSRSKMVGRGVEIFVVQLAAIVLCLVALFLINSGKIDLKVGGSTSTEVEKKIATGIKEESGYDAVVDCPDEIPTELGSSYQCVAMVGGSSVAISVSVTGNNGEFWWRALN